jgi:hypothetical protein
LKTRRTEVYQKSVSFHRMRSLIVRHKLHTVHQSLFSTFKFFGLACSFFPVSFWLSRAPRARGPRRHTCPTPPHTQGTELPLPPAHVPPLAFTAKLPLRQQYRNAIQPRHACFPALPIPLTTCFCCGDCGHTLTLRLFYLYPLRKTCR